MSPRTARTRNSNSNSGSRNSQCSATFISQSSCKTGQKAQSSFSLLRKTGSDGDERTVSGRLFQTDAAAAGKARSPMVARTVRGTTSADVVDERSRGSR